MEPEKAHISCFVCGAGAVALEIGDIFEYRTAVEWCINGHIVVVDPYAPKPNNLVWEMNQVRPIER